MPFAVVARPFYARDPRSVAPELLGKLLVHDDPSGARRSGRIVEVEAYCGSADPGSHAYRGETPRNRTMFGPPGHLYVYFTYGMHWCANVVTGDPGEGLAVLLRALAPVDGIAAMQAARPRAQRVRDLCNGPGKLCQALGITGAHDGLPLDRPPFRLRERNDVPEIVTAPRIGITRATELSWRYLEADNVYVSRARPRA